MFFHLLTSSFLFPGVVSFSQSSVLISVCVSNYASLIKFFPLETSGVLVLHLCLSDYVLGSLFLLECFSIAFSLFV